MLPSQRPAPGHASRTPLQRARQLRPSKRPSMPRPTRAGGASLSVLRGQSSFSKATGRALLGQAPISIVPSVCTKLSEIFTSVRWGTVSGTSERVRKTNDDPQRIEAAPFPYAPPEKMPGERGTYGALQKHGRMQRATHANCTQPRPHRPKNASEPLNFSTPPGSRVTAAASVSATPRPHSLKYTR
jgi:hypothetical protein